MDALSVVSDTRSRVRRGWTETIAPAAGASYGISDDPGGIHLYTPRRKTGVLVTGKPTKTKLPPPFDQVPQVGLGHQVHHKFVVCGRDSPGGPTGPAR